MKDRGYSLDTAPEAFRRRIEALRALGSEGRLAAGLALCDEVRDGLVAAARERRRDGDDEAAGRDVARLLLGDALFRRVFPDSP